MQKTIEVEVGSSTLKIETGRWAKQSNGAAVVSFRDNMILATANSSDEAKEGQDFFPLMVDFRENNFAAGKIPGGYFKREGKPSEREVLLSRLIDRPIRPLFPEAFLNETQVIAYLLSADFSVDYDSLGIIGASAALLSSTIPFTTPVGAVKIGRRNGGFVVNPGLEDVNNLDMLVQVAGTEDDVVMLEANGDEFSEEDFKEALAIGKEIIRDICIAQKELINPDKMEVVEDEVKKGILDNMRENYTDSLKDAVFTVAKKERHTKLKALFSEITENVDEELLNKYKSAFHDLEYEVFRKYLVKDKKRNDGRAFDEVRQISMELGVLPRVHGSAIFTRGETQALATVTLGAEDDAQRIDALNESNELKRFMLHYNFPPFSVGEVSFLRGAGRREIGHGNLAEKALKAVLPSHEEFPYTIRIVSDILESNGSSSQATVCGGALALMNAGVPVKAPVSGIAMGLVKEGDDFAVLTDIAGYEDHFGDMDFKIAGTENGITAVQLDIKIDGLNEEIINKTLEDAKKARLFILDKMKENISSPSGELSEFAPVMKTIKINTDKIRDLIGPGGKTIKELVARFKAKVNTDDDGNVSIMAPDQTTCKELVEEIRSITASPEVGKTYSGKIFRIEDYGVFVEILNGATGLVHISEIAPHRLRTIKDSNLKMGQKVDVKVIGMKDNKVQLSIKALLKKADAEEEK